MDGPEFGDLLNRVGQLIEKSTPIDAEYWRGYFQGIQVYYRRGVITVLDHHDLPRIADRDHDDPYLNAYALGFRDGCDGKKPSHTPQAVDIPPERDKAAG
jgi:hypothetical protein